MSKGITVTIKAMQAKIARLEKEQGLEKNTLEEKYRDNFDRQARYLGNGIYSWCNVNSIDTRELFLMGVLIHEGIKLNIE